MILTSLSIDQRVFLFASLLYLIFAAVPLASFLPCNKWGRMAQFGSPLLFVAAAFAVYPSIAAHISFVPFCLLIIWPFSVGILIILNATVDSAHTPASFLLSPDNRLKKLAWVGALILASVLMLGILSSDWGGRKGDLDVLEEQAASVSLLSPGRQERFSNAVAEALCDGELTYWELATRPYPLSLATLSKRLQEEEFQELRKKRLEALAAGLQCSSASLE